MLATRSAGGAMVEAGKRVTSCLQNDPFYSLADLGESVDEVCGYTLSFVNVYGAENWIIRSFHLYMEFQAFIISMSCDSLYITLIYNRSFLHVPKFNSFSKGR
jgi:hypothetical protein